MHFIAVLNRDGGTLRTTDLDAFGAGMQDVLEKAGHTLHIDVVEGSGLETALTRAAAEKKADVVMIGGGDGSVSAAAAILQNGDKALAILPAGTMNLFARSLGIPLGLDAAVQAFATGRIREVDMASANGRPFVHQFSLGMHAKMVGLRDRMEFGSRLGKIRASVTAAYHTIMRPPSMRVSLRMDGTEILTKTTGLGITNNLFGEGYRLPYAADPAGGVLGIYITVARQPLHLVKFFFNMLRGRWRSNDQVEIHEAREVTVEVLSLPRKSKCVIDGELMPLSRETVVQIHPKSLRVLVPADEGA
ncbi:diacylglycerol/lipid kinase family protein [Mesorhizobium sp. 1B3]|uniref:diacylglycerol/lipid kinase family protein n=1 Tax=Mesorhizobium sp. 1B3 TaxID=3243599 RepID=UPI003D97137C